MLSVSMDSAGWTVIGPSADTQVIYVSNSQGNDANDGRSASRPVRTLARGQSLLRDGYPDWLLLRKGDVWTNQSFGDWTLAGRSEQERMLLGSYGSGPRPMIKPASGENGFSSIRGELSHTAVIGIHFYAHTRNPTDPAYNRGAGSTHGIRFRDDSGQSQANFLIEDNYVEFFSNNISIQDGSGGAISNVEIRRNVVVDAYGSGNEHSQGIWVREVDGLLIEGNVVDHNGWYGDRDTGGAAGSGGAADDRSHNIYLTHHNPGNNVSEIIVRDNVIGRGSAFGIQARSGGTLENNLFVRNPHPLFVGGANSSYDSFFPNGLDGVVSNNVITEGEDTNSGRPSGKAIRLRNIRSASVDGNLVFRDDGTAPANTWGIQILGTDSHPSRNIDITNNTFYDWRQGAVSILGTVSIATDANNKYWDADGADWPVTGSNQNSESVTYPDPTRTIASYNAMLGGSASVDAFFAEVRQQSKDTWRSAYTADAANDYFRAGFSSSSSPGGNTPPSVRLTNTLTSLSENTSTSSRLKVADIVVTDDGVGSNSLSLSGSDAGMFQIIASRELYLRAGTSLDADTNPRLDVVVRVNDPTVGGNPDDTDGMSITVTAAATNSPPSVAFINATSSLPEDLNTSSRVKVADILVVDDGIGFNALSPGGPDAGMFEIIGSELYLRAGTSLDADNNPRLDVSVRVNDPTVGGNPDDTDSMSITVTAAATNSPPSVALINATTSLPEDLNTSSRVKVADILVVDDGIGFNALSRGGPDSGMFEIIGSELYLRAGTSLDADNNPRLDVSVNVNDPTVGGTPDDEDSMSITVTAAATNSPPSVALFNATTMLSEDTDTSSRVKVADIAVIDDGIGFNALSLSGPNAGMFEIINSRELYLRAGENLDSSSNPSLNVTVRVNDATVGTTPDDNASLTITVVGQSSNSPPSVALANVTTSLPETASTSSSRKVADVIVTDDGIGTNGLWLSGPDALMFRFVGVSELHLRAGVTLDASANPILNVNVLVNDNAVGGSPDDMASLAISVVGSTPNLAPALILANVTDRFVFSGTVPTLVKIADIVVVDDGIGTNQLLLYGADASLFEIRNGNELYLLARSAMGSAGGLRAEVTVGVDDSTVGGSPDDEESLVVKTARI